MQPAGDDGAVAVSRAPVDADTDTDRGTGPAPTDHGPGTAPTDRTPDPGRLFALFNAALAVALIVHQLWWHGVELITPHAVVVLAAFWVLGRPRSVGRFALMLAAEVVSVGLDMPSGGSHILLLLVVAVVALVQLGWSTARRWSLPDPGAVFAELAPFLRAAIVVVYVAAALSKLNTGFVDPLVSCAASMSRQVAWFDPSLLDGSWRAEPAIWGTVAMEGGLPILLTVRRTRVVGLLLGIGFHLVLALAGNVPFTAVALALYVAFLPFRPVSGIQGYDTEKRSRGLALPAVLVGGWLAAAALAAEDPALVGVLVANGLRLVVVVISLVAAALLIRSRHGAGGPPQHQEPGALLGHPILLLGTTVLVVNALCPYLGLKTDSSFEMFSNLRTEPGGWNHLLVPESVRVFGGQDGAVRVVASTDPGLVARTAGGVRIVPFELDRALRDRPGTVATVVGPDGDRRTVGPLPAGETLLERIAVFRDVPPPTVPRC